MLPSDAFAAWRRKRKLTTIAFTIENILIGSDFSLTFLTLWLYLEELVKPSNPKVYYSIISASFLLASMSLSLAMGRLVDRYRNVKATFLIINIMVVIGNVIYTLQFSPIFLIAGRLLSGLSGPLRSVISGELARCYPKQELSSKFSIMGMAYSLGFIAGPVINFSFKHLNFKLGTWHVTYVNAPGLFLAFMFVIATFMTIFMIFDLSKEYDMKAERERTESGTLILTTSLPEEDGNFAAFLNQPHEEESVPSAISYPDYSTFPLEDDGINISPRIDDDSGNYCHDVAYKSTRNTRISVAYFKSNERTNLLISPQQLRKRKEKKQHILSITEILKKLLTNFDTRLLLLGAFFENYFVVSFDIWFPLLIVDIMKWTITELNIVIIGTGIWMIGACVLLIYKQFSDHTIFIIAIFATFSIVFMEGTFMFLSHFNTNQVLNIVVWILFDFCYCFMVITEEVFFVGCLAKMVSSEIQTFVDSIRLTVYRLGGLVALATSALIFDWILIVGSVHVVAAIFGAVLLLVRRKTLGDPDVIIR